jgi:hypothetical protein
MAAARFEGIIGALEAAQVRYVVAGGFAVNLHGFLRFTKDLDLLIDLEPANARQAMQVLASVGLKPRVPAAIADFADPVQGEDGFRNRNMRAFQLRDPDDACCTVDEFIRNPIAFERLWANSEWVELGRTACRTVGTHDLIAMKERAGRPQGQRDIEVLRHILRLSGREGS